MDLIVQRANQQELYIPYLQTFKFSSFKLSSLLLKTIRPKNTDCKLHIAEISYLPKVKTSTSSGCHHPKGSYLNPMRFPWIHFPREKLAALNSQMMKKLFDVDDDVGTSTITDLSVPSEDEEEEVKSNNVGNMPLISFLNSLDFILMGKDSKNGSNIKTWMIWNPLTNRMRNVWQLENSLHLILRTHGIKVTQNS